MTSYGLLDQNDEDNLHALRLLNVEEKTFKRLTKRLLGSDSLVTKPNILHPIPPPDATAVDKEAKAKANEITRLDEQHRQWRNDVLLDFAAYESNLIRVQFLLNSNAQERERYAAEKFRIEETAQTVRDNNTQLHEQLKEAQTLLAVRKQYDTLADKITSNKTLKPRGEQQALQERLNAEIAELERESAEYSKTWAERREQFGRIVEEGMQMLRLIRDEKEEAERKEGMEDVEDADDAETSKTGTPRPSVGLATPAHESQDGEEAGEFQASAPKIRSLVITALAQSSRADFEGLNESGVAEDAPMTDGDGKLGEDGDIEEGEEMEDQNLEKMDTT